MHVLERLKALNNKHDGHFALTTNTIVNPTGQEYDVIDVVELTGLYCGNDYEASVVGRATTAQEALMWAEKKLNIRSPV